MRYPKLFVEISTPVEEEVICIPEDRLLQKPLDNVNGVDPWSVRRFGVDRSRTITGVGHFLSSDVDWVIARDAGGHLVLVPLKKEKRA